MGWIANLKIKDGEKKRLELAVAKLKNIVESKTPKPAGAYAVDVKREPAEQVTPESSEFVPTTTSLARDAETKVLLDSLLSNQNQLSGLRDLLSLAGLQVSATATGAQPVPKGEKTKPLLIRDFITSTFNCQYRDEEEKVQLSDNAELIVKGKAKKPEVEQYTVELWCAANTKIILHLLKTGTPIDTITKYVEYSSWIGDYFQLYVHKGIFLLDERHRIRVATEGRGWNDIYFHDIHQFLVVRKPSSDYQVNKSKLQSLKPKRTPKRKVLDAKGIPCCFNFNSTKGCDAENCQYTHLCTNPGCLGKHSAMECSRSKSK